MSKIKCPHCGANNQDVEETDPCWQCSTVLGSAPSDTSRASVTAAASKPAVPAETPLRFSPERRLQGGQSARIITLAVAVVIIVLVVAYAVMHHH